MKILSRLPKFQETLLHRLSKKQDSLPIEEEDKGYAWRKSSGHEINDRQDENIDVPAKSGGWSGPSSKVVGKKPHENQEPATPKADDSYKPSNWRQNNPEYTQPETAPNFFFLKKETGDAEKSEDEANNQEVPIGESELNNRERTPTTKSQKKEGKFAHNINAKLPYAIRSKFSDIKSILDDLKGNEKRPEQIPMTDEFLDSLSLEEAVALLNAELQEENASGETSIEKKKSWKPQRLQQFTEKVSELAQKRTMTLTVENEIVRIVIFQGREIIAWGTANPKDDPVRGLEMGVQDEEYSSRLKGLLSELEFRRLRIVTDLPLYVPLMRHFQIPKIPKRYLDSVVVSEVLETIPFSAEEIDVPWQFRKVDQGNDVYAVAVPKKAIDEHVKVLKGMDIQPAAAYSRATALAFAAGISNAITLHISPGQAAIILIKDGAAQVVHRLELAWEKIDNEYQAELIIQAIDQVLTYYEPNNAEYLNLRLPVIFMGQSVGENPVVDSIREALPYEVLPFAPPIVYPEHFVPEEYAVNIGLALSDWAKAKTQKSLSRSRNPSVNLLSERHLPKPLPVWPAATFITLLMFGVMAFNVTGLVSSAEQEVGALEQRLTNLEQQERRTRLVQGQAKAVEQQIASADLFQGDLETQLAVLSLDKDILLLRAKAMTREALPPTVYPNTVSNQAQGFVISGTADSYENVLQYTANLRDTGLFSTVTVTRVSGTGSEDAVRTVSFSVNVVIDERFLPYGEEEDEFEDPGDELGVGPDVESLNDINEGAN